MEMEMDDANRLFSQPTVAGKPNAFFTANNVARFGLAQPLSTTQTRCVTTPTNRTQLPFRPAMRSSRERPTQRAQPTYPRIKLTLPPSQPGP
jgi:hypothetical protein